MNLSQIIDIVMVLIQMKLTFVVNINRSIWKDVIESEICSSKRMTQAFSLKRKWI